MERKYTTRPTRIPAHLTSRIDEAELQFALRDFQHALTQANGILLDQILLGTDTPGPIQNCFSKSDDGFTSQHSPIYEIPLRNPLQEYKIILERRQDRDRHLDHDHDSSSKKDTKTHFMVGMAMNLQKKQHSSMQERAAAIAIQSSYELWKIRSPRVIDERLCSDLSPFLKNYDRSMSTEAPGFVEFPTFMSFDLAALYIHFCHAIGLYQSSIISSLQMFSALIHIEPKIRLPGDGDDDGGDDDDDGGGAAEAHFCNDDNDQDHLYNYYSDVLDMIMVQIIPFIADIRIVESITDAIFTIIRDNGNDTSHQHLDNLPVMWSMLKISPSIESASIKVACRNLEAIILCEERKMSICVREALQDTLIDVLELLKMSHSTSGVPEIDGGQDRIRSNVESAANRLKGVEQLEMEKGSSDEKEGKGTGAMEDIVEYLWESDERWLNRGKVLSLGLVSYCAWKRRHRTYGGAKIVLNALLSPAREILNAIASPLK